MIALSNDNQWTVELYMYLPDYTHQFHVQYDFRFCLKGPGSSVRGKKDFLSAQSNFNYCRKVLSKKTIWIHRKTKKHTPKSVLRWGFASV